MLIFFKNFFSDLTSDIRHRRRFLRQKYIDDDTDDKKPTDTWLEFKLNDHDGVGDHLLHRLVDIEDAILRLMLKSNQKPQYQSDVAASAVAVKGINVQLFCHQHNNNGALKLITESTIEPFRWIELDVRNAMLSHTIDQPFRLLLRCTGCTELIEPRITLVAREINIDATDVVNERKKRSAAAAAHHQSPRSKGAGGAVQHHRLFSDIISNNNNESSPTLVGGSGALYRRTSRRTDCSHENKRCCRHQMEVVFKELKGFEFIIQPKMFDAGYCRGRCPPRYNPAHHHALLQAMVWKQDRSRAPRPCCAPSRLVEMEVLHVDERDASKLKVSTWSDMRVLECACS